MIEPSHSPLEAILLFTDLGPCSDRALDRALSLAALWRARLVIAHRRDSTPQGILDQLSGAESSDKGERNAIDDLGMLAPDAKVYEVRDDSAQEIMEIAEAEACGLILATVGRLDGPTEGRLGKDLDRLLRTPGPPVLIVRSRPTMMYEKIIATSDIPVSSLDKVEIARRLFPDAAVSLFHASDPLFGDVVDDEASMLDDLRRQADSLDAREPGNGAVSTEVVLEVGPPGLSLAAHVESHGGDLVIVGVQPHGPVASFVLGSVGMTIAETVPCDVLVLRSADTTTAGTTSPL